MTGAAVNYYNEFDPDAAQWLRNLITAGLIPAGDVDERSIEDVMPNDLRGYTQCHFFAGIGGWPLALDLSGWPHSRPIWSGSCPCQPFSQAGLGNAAADKRHLWPHFARLIKACRPVTVVGEQVASGLGRAWLSGVRSDMDILGYAFGAADLCAAGVGAPHIRQRLYWVADARSIESRQRGVSGGQGGARRERWAGLGVGGTDCGVADSDSERGRERTSWEQDAANACSASEDAWRGVYVPCADGKSRRIEPGLEPLAHGIPARVVRLRGYGNAIVPQVAAAFVRAFMDVASEAENEAAA